MVRFLLGQVVLHLMRRDSTVKAWYQRIKRRRGSRHRAGGGDAADGHDHVADAQQGRALAAWNLRSRVAGSQ